ncbi:MAG: SRPBCC domain-containing protein [Microbacterium sp.]
MDTETTDGIGLELQREVAASPQAVFDALTDPDRQRLWLSALGPEAGAVATSVDLRVGGVWESTFRASPEITVHDVWTYREIEPARRVVADLVGESTAGGKPMPTLHARIVLGFEATASGTLVTVEQTGFPSEEMRGFFENVVWPGALGRIETLLTAAGS